MQPNYEAEARRRQQQQYQNTRNPFELGQQVAQRRYSEIMSGLDNQMLATQKSYGDMYQAARQRAVGSQAMGGPTLSGGMGQQRRDYVSALEMQELNKIGIAQNQAMADLYTQQQAAFSNAQLEGQQATQMELQNRQAELGLVQQKQEILANGNLSDEQKTEQLAALGVTDESEPKSDFESAFDDAVTGGLLVGGAAVAGAVALKVVGATALIAAGTAALPFIAIGALAAVVIGGISYGVRALT